MLRLNEIGKEEGEILGSQNSTTEDSNLLGCDTV